MTKFMKYCLCLLAVCGVALSANAQGVISTVVGGGPNGIPAIDANLYNPYATAVDASGNVYVASQSQHIVFKISTSGTISIIAGKNGVAGYNGDGIQGGSATLYNPRGVAVDNASPANVYIADFSNCLVRKVSQSSGIITTVAGLVTVPTTGAPYSSCGYTGNGGAANAAEISGPYSVSINPSNNDLYIVEYYNGVVRKVAGGTATGTISLVAGSGGSPTTGNNCGGTSPYGDTALGTAAFLCNPTSVTVDNSSSPANIFITDYSHSVIREVVGSSGKIYQVAGNYTGGFVDNVVATSGELSQPYQTHVSVSGGTTTVQIADYANARIRQFTQTYSSGVPKAGNITTIGGKGQGGFCGDAGSVLNACMNPIGLAYDSSGNYYIGDYGSDRVRKVTKSDNNINTIAGWGQNGGTEVSFSNPVGLTNSTGTPAIYNVTGVYADASSTKVYISDYNENNVYVWDSASKEISNLAGNTIYGYAGDGGLANSTATEFEYPITAAKDSSGNIYIADQNNCLIREVNASSGDISTFAGGSNNSRNGCGYTGDGNTAVNAQFNAPTYIAFDTANNLYISDYNNCAIRKINHSDSTVSTIAGGIGCGYSGDGGLATAAKIRQPQGIALDAAGNIYFSDYANQRIRKIDALSKVITTIAGNGVAGYSGDGLAVASQVYYPVGLSSDANGNLFLADGSNQIVRWITPSGVMITFGGTPQSAGYVGDGGSALTAKLYTPQSVAQNSAGDFYIADYNNQVVRQITAFAGYGLSKTNINFGTQPSGSTSNFQAITVSAIGPTTFSSVKVSSGFSEIDDCSNAGTFNAGQTCEIDVYFTPTAAGTTNGTLTINSDASFAGNPNTVALTGNATGLALKGSLNFYTVPLFNVSYKTVTLTNSGSPVTISKIYLANPSAFYFGSNGTCPRSGGTLAKGASCTIPVNFSPKRTGGQTVTLVVASNDPASPLLAQPQGLGTEVKLSASSINFGTITHGTSSTVNLTISNTGTAAFTLSPAITGSNFSISGTGKTCGSSLAGGTNCVLPIEYAPTAAGSNTGTLKITTNGGSSPSVALTGAAN